MTRQEVKNLMKMMQSENEHDVKLAAEIVKNNKDKLTDKDWVWFTGFSSNFENADIVEWEKGLRTHFGIVICELGNPEDPYWNYDPTKE